VEEERFVVFDEEVIETEVDLGDVNGEAINVGSDRP